MASTFASQAPYSFFLKTQNCEKFQRREEQYRSSRRARTKHGILQVSASKGGAGKRPKAPPGVDTRIHWDNPDEGWIGGTQQTQQKFNAEDEQQNLLADKFADLLNNSSDSHYQ